MIKILFVCHGNICRSPMAEFIFKALVKKEGLSDYFEIASAATSQEALGYPVHRGTRKKLAEVGISTEGKRAVQMTRMDYKRYDYLIGMDDWNIRNILGITGPDTDHKIYKLLDFTSRPGDIADPWYTGNFDDTYKDVLEGCKGLLQHIIDKREISR